jgi:hypothetical protein
VSLLARYHAAMRKLDGIDECLRIEQDYSLLGYPPEIVSVGLKAIDEGRDAHDAIDAYLEAL